MGLFYYIELHCIVYMSIYDFFHLISYADDTTLYQSLSRRHDPNISHHINTELEKVYAWLCYNHLSLNINKTKYMIFHTRGKKIS